MEVVSENKNWQEKHKALEKKFRQEMVKEKQASKNHQTKEILEKQDWLKKYKALGEKFRKEMANKEQTIRLYESQTSDLNDCLQFQMLQVDTTQPTSHEEE